jgi:hypothetical protein
MIGHFRTLGIEQGKPFAPDAQTKNLLTCAAACAQDASRAARRWLIGNRLSMNSLTKRVSSPAYVRTS